MSNGPSELPEFKFNPFGLAAILKHERLCVPPNQREYAWETDHVQDLFRDLSTAVLDQKPIYFLGTIVVNTGTSGAPQIVDGQQRLATTTILLAAYRDWLLAKGDSESAGSIESEYLSDYDRSKDVRVPRLTLNVDDNEFFRRRVLAFPDAEDRLDDVRSPRQSHKNIDTAARLAAERIQSIAMEHRDPKVQLERWIEYLHKRAIAIVLRAPNAKNAFSMFETLNDRGLRTTLADLLKSYLFEQCSEENVTSPEAQGKWSSMLTCLEPLGLREPSLTYLRHVAIAMHGPIGKDNFYEKIQSSVSGRVRSLKFLSQLANLADDYAAILTPSHGKWNDYSAAVPLALTQMKNLGVTQIRPLMLAVAHKFEPLEAEKAFRAFVSWTVRFLIVGGMRGQALEDAYAEAAYDVAEGKITTTLKLREKLQKRIPGDARFKSDFATATVSSTDLARYYLNAIEIFKKDSEEYPELQPIDDRKKLNLEHVLPQKRGNNWPHWDPDVAAAYVKRLGNLVLMNAKKNVQIGNLSFKDKRAAFGKSQLLLTRQIFDMTSPSSTWEPKDIAKRQEKLAEDAVLTWPL